MPDKVEITAVHLWRDETHIIVSIELNGIEYDMIRELADSQFDHWITANGIGEEQRLADNKTAQPVTIEIDGRKVAQVIAKEVTWQLRKSNGENA